MPLYKNVLMNHFKDLLPVLERTGAEASLNMRNFQVELHVSGRSYTLYPQFMTRRDGRRQYTPNFERDAALFIGWCPYFNKRWDLSNEKLKFKAYALSGGLLTPEYSTDPKADLGEVLVKRSVSSFSEDIKGPFHRSKEHALDAGAGEFYERFVRGRIAKIYYWENRPILVELGEPAAVTGDGARTLRQLLEARIADGPRRSLEGARAYLAYLGKSLEDILGPGVEQEVDFRYSSAFNLPDDIDAVDLTTRMIPELASQLAAIGDRLWKAIPDDVRGGTLYTVDAILGAENKLWLLEMNSNPFIHPLVYPAMLEALFKSEGAPGFVSRVPTSSWASMNEILELATTQLKAGAVEQALALLEKILGKQPNHPAALFYSGWALAQGGRLGEARDRLDLLMKTALRDNIYLGPAADLLESIGRSTVHPSPAVAPGVIPAGILPPGANRPIGH